MVLVGEAEAVLLIRRIPKAVSTAGTTSALPGSIEGQREGGDGTALPYMFGDDDLYFL